LDINFIAKKKKKCSIYLNILKTYKIYIYVLQDYRSSGERSRRHSSPGADQDGVEPGNNVGGGSGGQYEDANVSDTAKLLYFSLFFSLSYLLTYILFYYTTTELWYNI
jgi:hypothetical protein